MSYSTNRGTPYPGLGSAEIDEWSEGVFRALVESPIARHGHWSRWEPGYLLLVLDRVDGEEVDPIQVYTAGQEVTIEFGYWVDHLRDEESPKANPELVAKQAEQLVQEWLNCEIRTAVFSDSGGKWCGTMIVEPGDLNAQLMSGAKSFREHLPHSVQLRSLRRRDWTTVLISPAWIVDPPLSPDRLP
jgi:hypothetical protein